MSKKLRIASEECLLRASQYGVEINGIGIEKIITESLPKLENFKDYSAKVNIEIEVFKGDKDLIVTPDGYEIEGTKTDKELEDEE